MVSYSQTASQCMGGGPNILHFNVDTQSMLDHPCDDVAHTILFLLVISFQLEATIFCIASFFTEDAGYAVLMSEQFCC